MIKGIIFDLDGTLLNTINDLNRACNITYEKMGVNKIDSVNTTKSLVGHGIKDLISKCFKDSEVDINEAYNTFLDVYRNEYYKTSLPYEGINELIDKLIKLNIKIGVNSNKNDEYTRHLIELNFPSINLDYVLGKIDTIKTKPDPKGLNIIINKMNLNNSEVIYCGDSPTDVLTAKNGNLKCISVTWGFRSKDILKEYNDILVDKPSEILELINCSKM